MTGIKEGSKRIAMSTKKELTLNRDKAIPAIPPAVHNKAASL